MLDTTAAPSHMDSHYADAAHAPLSGNVVANAMSDSESAAIATADLSKNSIWSLPELAERYVPMYSSLEEITYRDPKIFSLKPPCWEAWTADEYRKTAEYLQRIKLHPLARALGKPVEEVYHVLQALVSGPLYEMEKASRRGTRGIRSLFALYNEHGTLMRPWTKEGIIGELDGVAGNKVELILDNGTKGSVNKEDLIEEDLAWLEDHGFSTAEAAPMDFRLWTDECIMAAFVNVSYTIVVIATKEGRTHTIKKAQLNDGDKLWMKKHISRALLREFLGLQPGICYEQVPEEARKYLGGQPLEVNSATAEGELSKYRVWTRNRVVAKLEDVSNGSLCLKRCDGGRFNVPVLTETDRKVFNDQLSDELKEKMKTRDRRRNTQASGLKALAASRTSAQAQPSAATQSVRSKPSRTAVLNHITPVLALSRPVTLEAPSEDLVRLQYDSNHLDLSSGGKRKRDPKDSSSPEAEGRRLMACANLEEALENESRMNTPRKNMTPAMQQATTPKAPRAAFTPPAPPASEDNVHEQKVSTVSTASKKNVFRGWGPSKFEGQLVALWRSNVRVRTRDGTEKIFRVKALTEEDVMWLRNALRDEKLDILLGQEECFGERS